jgi:hypothetical protein
MEGIGIKVVFAVLGGFGLAGLVVFILRWKRNRKGMHPLPEQESFETQ